ncbi:hypothetical protein EKH77_29635 [Streptomyces luteoverticillatus]|uniref:Uncharacterized protein n=1 Tax=Streptomyces luteoverticillatus TaxID=66425 RepID=A0A3S9PR92_STRLT|nr:DUF5947 family protein [Streptomyces luteoverticillatus]AZQ74808.1 hypothetical protein EKH77_29635 [Streptomyces luteoverticillatus]
MTGGALARVIARPAAGPADDPDRCDLCGVPAEDGHRHLYGTGRAEVLCACRACALLFTRETPEAAGEDHYLLIPTRRVRLPPVPTEGLGVPVGLAFFVPRADGEVTAHYPSPAGATRWEVVPESWREVVDRCPPLRTLVPEVEALLVNTARGRQDHWIIPVDDCYRLVALVRREWRGLSGGDRIRPAIEGFFADLAERGEDARR